MEGPGGAKKLIILVTMVALVYGSVVAEAQQINVSKKCLFRAGLCIVKCLGKCVVIPDSAITVAVAKVTAATTSTSETNPATCIVQCVESKCHISIAPPPEGEDPEPPPGEDPEPPPPEGDAPEPEPEPEPAPGPEADFGKVEADHVDLCLDEVGRSC